MSPFQRLDVFHWIISQSGPVTPMGFGRQDNMGTYPNAPPSWGSYNPQPQGPYYQQQLPPG